MTRLPQPRFLACLVLAWYVLFMGVATASPWVKSLARHAACDAESGEVQAEAGRSAGAPAHVHVLDCPVCLPCCAPPPALAAVALVSLAPAAAPQRTPAQPHVAAAVAPPLPARGPPPAA